MSSRRLLVTGVRGFVGRHLTRRAVERGEVVLGAGLDSETTSAVPGVTREWQADVCDAEVMSTVLEQAAPDAIVHLAGQSSAGRSFDQPVETFRVNALGTLSLLEAARRAAPRARILIVGSGEVYGPQEPDTRVTEDAPFRPVSPYALSKVAADSVAEAAARIWGLHVVRTRSFAHIGAGQSDRFVLPSIARQIAEAEIGRCDPVLRVGNLEVTRDITDVRDVVDAYLLLLAQGRSGEAYNVCRGQAVRLQDLVEELRRRARVPVTVEIDPGRLRPADIPYLVGDPSKMMEGTAWAPARPLGETLEGIMNEWRERARIDRPDRG